MRQRHVPSGGRRGARGWCVAAACAGLTVLAACGASDGDDPSATQALATSPEPVSGSSGSSGSSGPETAGSGGATASIPHPACVLSARRVAAISGLGYLTLAKAEPETGGRELCTYSSPRHGTRTLTVTYTAWDSVATAHTHWIEGTAASRDLGLVDVPGVGEHAWLFNRVGGPSHTTTQQQLQFLKANVTVQVATDESFLKLPPRFGARMAKLGEAVAATVS